MKKLSLIFMSLCFVLLLSACDLNAGDMGTKNSTPSAGLEQSALSESSDAVSETTVSQTEITREKAIEIALNHAGFKQDEVINLTAEYDRELSGNEWEVEFDKDNYEYSYEINAQSGEIIKNEKEID